MEKIKLIDICTPKQWKTMPTSELLEEGYPVYGANGIIGYCREYNHEDPVIAVTCRGATCGSVNITVSKSYVTGNAMCLDNLRSDVEIDYLYYCLKHYNFKNVISGSAQPQITRQGMKKVCIYICNHDEQIVIVHKLKNIENIIELRKRELKKLDDLVRGRFVELFGDPVSNSYGLPEATLPELGVFGRGVSKHRPRNDPKLLGGDYPLIQTGDIANAGLYITSYNSTYSEFGLKQSKMWEKGTLCITIAANIAKTAILEFDACFPDSVVGFTANERTNNIFIHYWFSFFQAILESQAPESAQKNINLKILSELKVIVPEKERQNEFANFVHRIDKSKFRGFSMLTTMKSAYEQQTLIYP